MGINVVTIFGRIGKKPEQRLTTGGTEVTEFSIAVDKRKKEDPPMWFRITAFGKQAEFANQYLDKGRQVIISGRLEQRKYEDRDGKSRESISIVAEQIEAVGSRPDGVKQVQGAQDDEADFDPFEDE
jgi:single-strand DNA-binding protein